MNENLCHQDFFSPIKKEQQLNLYTCTECPYQSKSSFALAQHLNHHHISLPTLFDCETSTPEPYHCNSCSFQTHLTVNFNKHVTSNDLSDITDVCEVFVCKGCNFETFSRLVFMKHAYDKCVNRKDRTRSSCKRMNVYNDKHSDYLKCHRFLRCIPYDNIRWLKCQHCSYQAKMKGDLKKHMGAYHMLPQRIKWFECEQCLFNVKQIFHLREHLLTKHHEDVACFDC